MRVAREAVTPGTSPLITIHQIGMTRVALLTDNDAEMVSTLRDIALNNAIKPNF